MEEFYRQKQDSVTYVTAYRVLENPRRTASLASSTRQRSLSPGKNRNRCRARKLLQFRSHRKHRIDRLLFFDQVGIDDVGLKRNEIREYVSALSSKRRLHREILPQVDLIVVKVSALFDSRKLCRSITVEDSTRSDVSENMQARASSLVPYLLTLTRTPLLTPSTVESPTRFTRELDSKRDDASRCV